MRNTLPVTRLYDIFVRLILVRLAQHHTTKKTVDFRNMIAKLRLFPVFLLQLSICCIHAMECDGERPYPFNKRQSTSIFFHSAEALITKVVQNDRDVIEGTRVIQEYLAYVEMQIAMEMSKRASNERGNIPVCEATESVETWRIGLCRTFGVRNWSNPASKCISDVSDEHVRFENPPYNVDQLWYAFNRRAEGFRRLRRLVGEAIGANFTNASDLKSFLVYSEKEGVQCTMHLAVAPRLKLGDKFRVEFQVQNAPKDEFLATGKRSAVIENASVDDGKLGNGYRMRLPLFKLENGERIWRTDSTSMISRARVGPLRNTAYTTMSLADNPSIVKALSKADIFLQQAASTVLPSSIAILFLPLGLTLVPISFISYMKTMHILLYTLMTDVVTVLPLAIKGAELINIQNAKYRAVVVRIGSNFDLSGRLPEVTGSESWAAQCETKLNLGRIGAAFLGIALSALVLGLCTEYFVFRYVRAKRRNVEAVQVVSSSRLSVSEEYDRT